MSYPPEHHMLRDLGISSEDLGDDGALARAPLGPHVRDDTGAARVGVIATLVDVAAAACVVGRTHPDRSATEQLSYCSIRPARSGPLLARARVLRLGSRQAVVEVELRDGQGSDAPGAGEPVGVGLMLSRRLPHRDDHAPIAVLPPGSAGRRWAPARPPDEPYLRRAGVRLLDAAAGALEIRNWEYVRNSFGTLNGGMVATLIEVAGEHAARSAARQPLRVADLTVVYLAQSGPGPIRSAARVLRVARDHAVCRVELTDAGNGDRLLSVGTVTCAGL
jgi:uncharacterized protein (TIGR00369 family)